AAGVLEGIGLAGNAAILCSKPWIELSAVFHISVTAAACDDHALARLNVNRAALMGGYDPGYALLHPVQRYQRMINQDGNATRPCSGIQRTYDPRPLRRCRLPVRLYWQAGTHRCVVHDCCMHHAVDGVSDFIAAYVVNRASRPPDAMADQG